MSWWNISAVLATVGLMACSTHRPTPEGYRVTRYDARSGEWTILRTGTFSGEYQEKRLTVVCAFFKWGNREAVPGPQACDLRVGRLLESTVFTKAKEAGANYVFIDETADHLSITEGEGNNQVLQDFRVVRYELLPTREK